MRHTIIYIFSIKTIIFFISGHTMAYWCTSLTEWRSIYGQLLYIERQFQSKPLNIC